MAKKSTKVSAAKAKQEKKAEEVLTMDLAPESSSSEELSSDEELDMEGLAQPEETSEPKNGHSVNVKTKNSKTSSATKSLSGVIYVGRLPKQFEEAELRKYFNQFGDVLAARVSRNKKTGASRHYAFVKFQQHSAAEVAAETMNNYLLFGHLLKVHIIDNPKENLFSAKMKTTFRLFDWRAKAFAEAGKPKPLEKWKELQQEFEKTKQEKFEELKTLGFDYALEA